MDKQDAQAARPSCLRRHRIRLAAHYAVLRNRIGIATPGQRCTAERNDLGPQREPHQLADSPAGAGTGTSVTVRCFATHPYTWATEDVGNLDRWVASEDPDEPLGTKEKQWVEDAHGDRWLFKFARAHDDRTLGEDWCECLVHSLAGLLGVPSACVTPATINRERGVLSKSFVTAGWRLEHGNEVLVRTNPDYAQSTSRDNVGYTIDAVCGALAEVAAPPALSHLTAFEAWSGYLVLDAWVSSRDRHHENWGVLQGAAGRPILAPSFDHGSALGFQEPEYSLQTSLAPREALQRWSQRGCSHHFAGKPQLVTLARQALTEGSDEARQYWLHRLEDVRSSDVREALDAVPLSFLSQARRRFVAELLDINRGRLLDACST